MKGGVYMKLDIDCVRDVLLEFEEFPLNCHTPYDFKKSIAKHGESAVEYALAKLNEAGYIRADIRSFQNGLYDYYGIFDITFSGHQFLEKIRDNKVWSKTKSMASAAGSRAFDVITQIATSIITEIISRQINSPA